MIIVETKRLLLREMTPCDAENAYHLNLDPEVIKYTGDAPFKTIDEARDFLNNYSSYKKFGFGRWAVEDKITHEFLGWCGLKYIEEDNIHDIGFRFLKKHWGKGFATEAAQACIEIGFSKFKMPAIIGRAAKANIASINVLRKLGLQYLKDADCHGDDAVIYTIQNPNIN